MKKDERRISGFFGFSSGAAGAVEAKKKARLVEDEGLLRLDQAP